MSIDKESEPITPEEYAGTQALLLSCAQMVRLLPLDKFLLAIEKADAIAPIIDPTLWIKAHKNLDAIKKMARGALAFQNSLPQVCKYCKVKEPAYEGAIYCGAACTARAEGKVGFEVQLGRCPQLILLASHYNTDGTCKCAKEVTGGVGKKGA